jgi:tetratricopeptide (TPR) repeat protein
MSALTEIQSHLEDGRYEEAYRLCEALSKKKREPMLFFYGACALFGLGHIRQAEKWVSRHAEAAPSSPLHLYLKAFLHLHRLEYDRALLCYTSILEIDPSDTFADSLIERMRSGEEQIRREVANPGSFVRFIPLKRVKKREEAALLAMKSGADRFRFILALFIGIGVIVIALSLFFLPRLLDTGVIQKIVPTLPGTPTSGSVIPPEQMEETPRFLYNSSAEAIEDYERARRSIGDGYVNRARVLLAKIEMSNAGFEITERARLLRDFIPVVDLSEFKDPVSADEIAAEPFMYRDAQIKWHGRVLSVSEDSTGMHRILFVPDNSSAKAVFPVLEDKNRRVDYGKKIALFAIFEKITDQKIIQLRPIKWEILER